MRSELVEQWTSRWPETPCVKNRSFTKEDVQGSRDAVNVEANVRSATRGPIYDLHIQSTLVAGGWISPLMGVDVDGVRRALVTFATESETVSARR